MLSWDTTTIATAVVNHSLVQSTMDVPLRQWDTTVAWFIQNYAGAQGGLAGAGGGTSWPADHGGGGAGVPLAPGRG